MALALPKLYSFVNIAAQSSAMVTAALQYFGLHEAPGAVESNPIILGWARELGLDHYRADDTPWCGLFMAKVAHDAGETFPLAPLWARNWSGFGNKAPAPGFGDVLVFARPGGGGHVGLYVAEDTDAFHVLGGNEGDAVAIVRISRIRLLAARRPLNAPASVAKFTIAAGGRVSQNEA